METKLDHVYMKFVVLVFFLWNITQGRVVKNTYVDVYPERIHTSRHKRDLSTHTSEGEHELEVTYQFNGLTFDLQRHEKIHHDGVLLRTYDNKTGAPKHEQIIPEQCYYHGKIRGNKDSYVFFSTCNGIHGSFFDGNRKQEIEKISSNGLHRVYDINDEDLMERLQKDEYLIVSERKRRDTQGTDESDSLWHTYHNDDYKSYHTLFDVDDAYKDYSQVKDKTRYIEMFVCVDNELYTHYESNVDTVKERVFNVLHQVDKAYQAINIRVVVVAIDIWNTAKFDRTDDSSVELTSFKDYWNNVIKKDDNYKNLEMDNAQFLSKNAWKDGVAGLAAVGRMCESNSVGINHFSTSSVSGSVVVIGHEMGHNLNFPHDGESCTCLTNKGCFMGGTKTITPGFSNCNLQHLGEKSFACLSNQPKVTLQPLCGNGIIDEGETCDCGTVENCLHNDPCCEPYNCRLKQGYQCSHVNNPSCCTQQCSFAKQGTMCREKSNVCDVQEYCTGTSAECPYDTYKMNGFSCDTHATILPGHEILQGVSARSQITGSVMAKHLKIVPREWKKDKEPCMKMEVLGCLGNEPATMPTIIMTKRLNYIYYMQLCLKPQTTATSCSEIPENTHLMYEQDENNLCFNPNENNLALFVLSSQGYLIHYCSQRKVCPNENNELIISSECDGATAKFRRTPGKSLLHDATQKCFVSNSKYSYPNQKDKVILGDACDEGNGNTRSLLYFATQDCRFDIMRPLADEQFAASSYKSDHYKPSQVRYSGNGWYAKKEEESWLTVNFPRTYKISWINMKDCYYSYVNWFNLYYSQDGTNYQPYISTEDSQSGKYLCFNGECIRDVDHQCKQLWGMDAIKADDGCWDKFNVQQSDYGTCSLTKNQPCQSRNKFCGQIQCKSSKDAPSFIDYANPSHSEKYKKETLSNGGHTCSGAAVIGSDQVGIGMVADGTKCGQNQMCVNQECITIGCQKTCTYGVCRNDGTCSCPGNLDPADGCRTELSPINGVWGDWSEFSSCSLACGGGKKKRFRYCNNPRPQYNGADCEGDDKESVDCNTEDCPVERSCRKLRMKLEELGKPLHDGVYIIKPKDTELKVFCDMNREGGGWTLIVSSATNAWTAQTVLSTNVDNPDLKSDYSILSHANDIKNSYLIKSSKFEYMLEANYRGKWGGIWEAPTEYSMSSNSKDTTVNLKKRFDEWVSGDSAISDRLPYINGAALTTSSLDSSAKQFGSITDNKASLHPSYWIDGVTKLRKSDHVWYWMREGEYQTPSSCLEISNRAATLKTDFATGPYIISPDGNTNIITQCLMDAHGGGWTLLLKTSARSGWTYENSISRGNSQDQTAVPNEYSIFSFFEQLKGTTADKTHYGYLITANGPDSISMGGIFKYPKSPSPNDDVEPELVERFGLWNDEENIKRFPLIRQNAHGIFIKAGSTSYPNDKYGAIIADGSDSEATYMTPLQNPTTISVYIKED